MLTPLPQRGGPALGAVGGGDLADVGDLRVVPQPPHPALHLVHPRLLVRQLARDWPQELGGGRVRLPGDVRRRVDVAGGALDLLEAAEPGQLHVEATQGG